MQELEYDHREQSSAEADRNLAVRFYTAPLKDDAASTREGRPIFRDVEMIELRVRGDRNQVVQRPVRPNDIPRFRDAYRSFTDGLEARESGTPLSEWPIMTASAVKEMAYLGFHTVEQLAGASDTACGKVMGLTGLKNKAKAFLELAKGNAPLEELQSQLEFERNAREAAEAQLKDISERMAQLERRLTSQLEPTPEPTPRAKLKA